MRQKKKNSQPQKTKANKTPDPNTRNSSLPQVFFKKKIKEKKPSTEIQKEKDKNLEKPKGAETKICFTRPNEEKKNPLRN